MIVLQVDRRGAHRQAAGAARTGGRADDTEDVIRHRQKVYAEQTTPLLDLYSDRGLVVDVDGHGTVEEVSERIWDALAKQDGDEPE